MLALAAAVAPLALTTASEPQGQKRSHKLIWPVLINFHILGSVDWSKQETLRMAVLVMHLPFKQSR